MNEYGEDTDARDRAFNEGREFEREAIVAWLRGMEFIDRVEHVLSKRIADWIERGEHLRADDE